jgi:hypothetical protein
MLNLPLVLFYNPCKSAGLLTVPLNLNFEIDNAEDERLYKPDSLDFI